MELIGTLVAAAGLAGSVVWASFHIGQKLGAMQQALIVHAETVSSLKQDQGRIDGRVRELERRVGVKGGP